MDLDNIFSSPAPFSRTSTIIKRDEVGEGRCENITRKQQEVKYILCKSSFICRTNYLTNRCEKSSSLGLSILKKKTLFAFYFNLI